MRFSAFLFGIAGLLVLAACSGGDNSHGIVPTAAARTAPQAFALRGPATMVPDTTGRFGLIQVLDNYYSGTPAMTAAQIQSEAPKYDIVWGAFQPSTWRAASSSIILSDYFVAAEDNKIASGHTLSWWQSNHPNWILYACTSTGAPTHDLSWSGTMFGNVPLAFYLPAVQKYELSLMIPYLKANSYNALAVDQSGLHNYTYGGNPNFGQTVNTSEFGCGTYSLTGKFQRRYGAPNTTYNRQDPKFATDTLNWFSYARTQLHSNNLQMIANHALLTVPTDSNESQFISLIDGMLNEAGYTHWGTFYTTNNFNLVLEWVEYLQQQGKAAFLSDYMCGSSSCSNDISTVTAAQADFALSSYALGNEGGEDLYVSPHGGSVYSYRPEFSDTYGTACSAYTQPATYVYTRRFSGALAIVNATTSSYSYTLPANHTYTDIEGRTVTNPLVVGPVDGYMLLTSGGNGCT